MEPVDPSNDPRRLTREDIEAMAEELFETARAEARRRLVRMPGTSDSPSDLAQSALAEILRDPERFDFRGPGATRGLVRTILAARIVRRLRAQHTSRRDRAREQFLENPATGESLDLAATGPGPASQLVWRELVAETEERIRRLEPRAQRMLAMAIEGRSLADIAKSEGITESNAQKIIWRARQMILPSNDS